MSGVELMEAKGGLRGACAAALAAVVMAALGAGFLAGGASANPDGVLCLGTPATIVGTDGDDVLVGTPGPDVMNGLGGDDVLEGGDGNDVMCDGAGDAVLGGGPGMDFGDGDYLQGLDGSDDLQGGDDILEFGPDGTGPPPPGRIFFSGGDMLV